MMIAKPRRRAAPCTGRRVQRRTLLRLLVLVLVVAGPYLLYSFAAQAPTSLSPLPPLSPPAAATSSLPPVHFIYTIGCGGASDTTWQLLQSTVLDSSFHKSGQRGQITRLVSGCVDETRHAKERALMSQTVLPQLAVEFTAAHDRPTASASSKKDHRPVYVQANRPTALLRYFKQLLQQQRADDVQEDLLDTVFVVLDPDFVFRKPVDESSLQLVKPGRFVTQAYGLFEPTSYAYDACVEAWHLADDSRDRPSSMSLSQCEALKSMRSYRDFFGGVPYMLLIRDWIALLEWWIPLVGPVLQRYPGIESDMISWAIAAKLVGLRGTRERTFMATCMSSESAPKSELQNKTWLHLCQSYYVPETRQGEQYRVNPTQELSYIVHASRTRYPEVSAAPFVYVFNKHWLKASRLLQDCSVPLLVGPPPLPATGGALSPHYVWFQFVCEEAVDVYNRAIVQFRQRFLHCEEGDDAASSGLILHESHRTRYGGGWNHVINL